MAEQIEQRKRKPKGEGLLDVEDLAGRWGMQVEKLKEFVRSEQIPFIMFGKSKGDKIRWDRVIFRLATIEKWEADSQQVYAERRRCAEQPQEQESRSLMRGGW